MREGGIGSCGRSLTYSGSTRRLLGTTSVATQVLYNSPTWTLISRTLEPFKLGHRVSTTGQYRNRFYWLSLGKSYNVILDTCVSKRVTHPVLNIICLVVLLISGLHLPNARLDVTMSELLMTPPNPRHLKTQETRFTFSMVLVTSLGKCESFNSRVMSVQSVQDAMHVWQWDGNRVFRRVFSDAAGFWCDDSTFRQRNTSWF